MEGQEVLNNFLNQDALNALIGGSIILLLFFLLLVIVFIVFYIIGAVKLYQKAGKAGWEAIIPFYNSYVLTEIAGLNWWYFLIAIAGTILSVLGVENTSSITYLASGFFNFFAFYNIAKRFNKNPISYGILAIFFAPIIVMILGFSKSMNYDKNIVVSPNGPIGDEKQNTSSQESERYCLGCGKKLSPGVKFCENCGKKVEE